MHSDLRAAFLRWSLVRAALARGWWLATALYLVVVADLSPSQLVLIGVFQGLTVVIAEVPAGAVADAFSRRLALVVAHVVMGAGMVLTGFVTAFPAVVVSQCLWGLGWAISSGADVAWITDELDRSDLIDGVLTSQGRYDLVGTSIGIVGFGALAWATGLSKAMVAAGLAMIGLGLVVATRWPETGFQRVSTGTRWPDTTRTLRRGISVARADRVILLVLAGTLLVNGGAEGFGRLFQRRLVSLGLPAAPDPIVWFAAIALLAAAFGAITLRYVEARVAGAAVARRVYVTACAVGAAGLVVFAQAPNTASAVAGSLLVSGVGLPTVRIAGTILVNRRTSSDVRATVHSLLSQFENLGEIICGLVLSVIAGSTSSSVTLMGSAVLVVGAGILVSRAHEPLVRDSRHLDPTADQEPSASPLSARSSRPRTRDGVVVDPIFAEPRLAEIYDAVNDDRSDLDAYLALVDELRAHTILDIGCGTGVFACALARQSKDVIGVDPAAASLEVARGKPYSERVRWLEGDAFNTPALTVDLVTMTGNVAQVFLTDAEWIAVLRRCLAALHPGGHLVFEVRDPSRRAWDSWTREATQRRLDIAGVGAVETWVEVTSVSLPLVSIRHTFRFEADRAVLISDSTLRFRDRNEIEQNLREVGLRVREVRDAPDRPSLEWVFVTQKPNIPGADGLVKQLGRP